MLISDIPRKNARLYPDRVALIDGDVRITFLEFNQRVNRLAHAILSLGLSKGDRVAVLNQNGYQYIELYFACAKAGTPIELLPGLRHELLARHDAQGLEDVCIEYVAGAQLLLDHLLACHVHLH